MKTQQGLTMNRKGDWMQTYLRGQFWPLDPREDEVFIEDIAHALSMICRYNGHCDEFYSVAEHSIHVSNNVPSDLALHGLLHDASEAYMTDMIRPIKRNITEFRIIEDSLDRVIFKKFGLSSSYNHSVIKQVDCAILADERERLLSNPPAEWKEKEPKLGIKIECWSPKEGEHLFLERFDELRANRSKQKSA